MTGLRRGITSLFAGVAIAGMIPAPDAQAGVMAVNGSCVASNLPNCQSDTLPFPGGEQLNFNTVYTLANGDAFRLSGTLFALSNAATPPQFIELLPEFFVKYLGSSPSQADTLHIVFSQNFQYIPTLGGTFTNVLSGLTVGTPGAGSTITMVNTLKGNSLPPNSLPPISSPLTPTFNPPTQVETLNTLGNPLTDSLEYTIVLGQGSLGGLIVEVAEPASAAVLGLGLVLLGAARRRRGAAGRH